MNKILKLIIIIPNLPFIVILSVYIIISIQLNSGFVETNFLDKIEIKKYINQIYPKHFSYFIAIMFYLFIIKILLK